MKGSLETTSAAVDWRGARSTRQMVALMMVIYDRPSDEERDVRIPVPRNIHSHTSSVETCLNRPTWITDLDHRFRFDDSGHCRWMSFEFLFDRQDLPFRLQHLDSWVRIEHRFCNSQFPDIKRLPPSLRACDIPPWIAELTPLRLYQKHTPIVTTNWLRVLPKGYPARHLYSKVTTIN